MQAHEANKCDENAAPSLNNDQALDLQGGALSYDRYKRALQRFLVVSQRRKRLLLALKQSTEEPNENGDYGDPDEGKQASSAATQRIFILSENKEPWNVFTSDSASPQQSTSASLAFIPSLRTKRLVFEWSDLHLSLLHSACISGDWTLVRTLLHHQSCALARDASGRIPLHHAAINEQLKIITLLLCHPDARLQVHTRDNSGYSAAHYVLFKLASLAHRRYPQCPVFQSRIKMKRISRRYRRLSRAADEMLRLVSPVFLSDCGDPSSNPTGDLDFSLKALDWRVRGDLWDATRSGDLERLKFLFQVYRKGRSSEFAVLTELGRSLLHEACDQKHLPVLYYLIAHHQQQCRMANKGLKDTSGCTALHYAAMRGFLKGCVVLLEDQQLDQDQGGGDNGDIYGHYENDSEALCLAVDARGRTALHWSLLTSQVHCGVVQRASVAKYLVNKCVSALHVVDEDGFTPLHLAIYREDVEIVELFVNLGANVNTVGSSGPARASTGGGIKLVKATAAWAPCGARFHCDGHRRQSNVKSPSEEHASGETLDTLAANRTTNGVDSEKTRSDQEEEGSPAAALEDSAKKPSSRFNSQEDESVSRADGNTVIMDTLKYWLPNNSKKKSTKSADSSSTTTGDERRPHLASRSRIENPSGTQMPPQSVLPKGGEAPAKEDDNEGDSSARGCRKYGGICSQCRVQSGIADEISSVVAQDSRSGVISPLVLAIRACERSSGAKSRCQDRVAIVELLLLSGADPNEDASDGHHSVRETSHRCPLIEALYVARSACPQIVPLLLNHGAKCVCITQLGRFCVSSTTSPRTAAETDTVMLGIMDILDLHGGHEGQQSASLLLTTMFEARCFNSLTRLLQRHHRDRAVAQSDGNQAEFRPFRLWSGIRTGLIETHKKATMLRLDREHLWFLCEWLKRQCQCQEVCPQDQAELRALLQHCLNLCLATWRRQSKRTLVSEHERLERQQMVSNSVELLQIAPIRGDLGQAESPNKTEPGQPERRFQYPAQWLDHSIALGFFNCTLVLLDSQLRDSQGKVSMDHLLLVYGDEALGNRHRPLGFPDHREFVLAMVEKCIATMEWTVAVQADSESQPSVVRVSMESIVRACAYNLPLELILKIWDFVGVNSRINKVASCMEKLDGSSPRVDGKTLVEWLVHHQRRDLIQLLLENRASTHSNRVLLWRDCVSAVVGACESSHTEPETKRELLTWLLTLYPSSPNGKDADEEGRNTIEWLALNRAMRCDSPLLFATIIEPLWAQVFTPISSGPEDSVHASAISDRELSAAEQPVTSNVEAMTAASLLPKSLFTRLVEMQIFHQIAQWNALKLAVYLINEHVHTAPLSDSEGVATTQWRDVLLGPICNGEESEVQSSPLAICYSLGHVELAQLLLGCTGSASESSESSPELQDLHLYGLFSTILRLNTHIQALEHSYSHQHRSLERLAVFQSVAPWQIACRFNLVTHLDALQLHQVLVSSITGGISGLLLVAITSGSLDALQWLLTNQFNISDSTSQPAAMQALFEAASKHPGDLYARMTLLLLDKVPYSSRLAGDGSNTTLLHRCVCFRNAQLMQKAVDKVLSLPDSSVNVLDAFGNAPVVYALVSGNLSSVCYLVGRKNASLEAEYEGQASFYYALQLLPCFAWRFVIDKLLRTETCRRRFLHCDGGSSAIEDRNDDGDCASSCACKGFEVPAEGEALTESLVACGFCGHGAESHSKIPFPPWFLDQYETYVAKPATPVSPSSQDDSDNEDQQDHGRRLERPTESDEATLEDQCGRLNIAMLTAITIYKHAAILKDYKLSVSWGQDPIQASTTALGGIEMASQASEAHSEEDAIARSLAEEHSSWSMFPLNVLSEQALDDDKVHQVDGGDATFHEALESTSATIGHEDQQQQQQRQVITGEDGWLPWHLYQEVKMVHASGICCHNKDLFTTTTTTCMWQHEIVSRWLQLSAASHIAQLQGATRRTTRTQLHLLRSPRWATRVAFKRWRKNTTQQHQQLQLEARLSNNNNNNNPRLVRKLQQFLSHWRFANAFVAFQRWKHTSESAQVRHMHLQALVEDVDAQMRHTRLETLREKHKQLQKRIAQL